MSIQESQIKLLIQSAVTRELEALGEKLSFWQVELPNRPQTLWESERPQPDLDRLLSPIKEETFLEADDELKMLCGIGWEFVWGKPAPRFVTQTKELIRQRSIHQGKLSDLERLWLTISAIDTDYF